MYDPQYQQQSHQPFSPSEIIPHAQLPGFVPPYQQLYQQMPRPDARRQNMMIYPNRGQIIGRTAIVAVCLLLLILLMVALFSIMFMGEAIIGMVVLCVFFIALIAFIGWVLWSMVSLLYPTAKPALIITSEGISVQKMLMQSGFFISWAEIDMIAPSSFMYQYFCIFPKNPDQFLARFSSLERFNRRLNAAFVGTPLYFPQVFMEKSVQEIISQIAAQYQLELSYNGVRLQW
ncbi:MAG TPA: STM3941 family protein [Ktedonobacteraceae bacterium]|nr:STM3941 family protein [Ktedonobacteraceae bacterium]